MNSSGALYIVSTPIGDSRDITLRAVEVLRECDIIVCEEWKPARSLLKKHSIEKELLQLNEHSKREDEEEILAFLKAGKSIALISDCGTPLVADPGATIVKKCIDEEISIVPVPGVSSILAALVVSGFSLQQFSFIGFLPREKSERKRVAAALRNKTETLVLLEAPYRLSQILVDLSEGIGPARNACVCLDLTMASEKIIRGTLQEARQHFEASPFKGEFVIVIEGSREKMPRPALRKH